MKTNMRVKEIEEMEIRVLHFPKEDVFFAPRDKARRDKSIQAVSDMEEPVCITFQDIEGAKTVRSQIRNCAKDLITLAGNVGIPVHRIIQIDLIK
ncbi:MAG: hypothetical protein ACPG21_10515 [Crocinitomicaceae bacterium]